MTFHEIRLAVRSLVVDRSVTAIVIFFLALGIGVNATLFSVIDGVLIQPLPFLQPDRLVVLNEISERRGIREADNPNQRRICTLSLQWPKMPHRTRKTAM